MQTKRIRTVREVLDWTKRDILILFCISSLPPVIYHLLGFNLFVIPWVPVALVGTALSFTITFKNNASYDRTWEARKVWGSIVNSSRALINSLIAYLDITKLNKTESQAIYKSLIRIHVAWLTALRFQLREPRQWENIDNRDYVRVKRKYYTIEEEEKNLDVELKALLSEEEFLSIKSASNHATQLLACQTKNLKTLKEKGLINSLQQIELQNTLTELYNQQGASERIKNFPYPRQFATLNLFYIKIFIFILPFGIFQEFQKLSLGYYVWLSIPFSVLVGWIFTTLEKVGDTSENPFQGGANDIPITQICRNIEIDMMNIIGEPHNLQPIQEENGILS